MEASERSLDAYAHAATGSVTAAWERMAAMLFRPFDIAKWFLLGFVVWLVELGRNVGFNGIGWFGPRGDNNALPFGKGAPDVAQLWAGTLGWLQAHLVLVLVVVDDADRGKPCPAVGADGAH
jgi:hypothetical protein